MQKYQVQIRSWSPFVMYIKLSYNNNHFKNRILGLQITHLTSALRDLMASSKVAIGIPLNSLISKPVNKYNQNNKKAFETWAKIGNNNNIVIS